MGNKVRKAVFPVAGLGTRFLPATKASPKEMLPVVDKPLIQYAAEEAIEAGAEVLVFVTGRGKRAIEDHFDRAAELEAELEAKGKDELLSLVRDIVPPHVSCVYVRQPQALGLGHAVLCARPLVGDEPFFVLLADDLIYTPDGRGCCHQLAAHWSATGHSVLAVQEIPLADTPKYGVIGGGGGEGGPVHRVECIVEKPSPEEAPSQLGVVGRYLLTPTIWEKLERIGRGAGGEIQLTDAIADLLKDESVDGLEYRGERFDCGSKLGLLQASVRLGKDHPEFGKSFSQWLKKP